MPRHTIRGNITDGSLKTFCQGCANYKNGCTVFTCQEMGKRVENNFCEEATIHLPDGEKIDGGAMRYGKYVTTDSAGTEQQFERFYGGWRKRG